MGQFRPMVKMMTTEPSVELKLKKGGSVSKPKKMMNGGVMSGLAMAPGARGGMMPAMSPRRPSMAARRAAMMNRPMMKEGGETKAEHAAEMKKMAGTEAKLKKHASMPASKAHKGLKTGGVVMGQGGYKKGGKVKRMADGGMASLGTITDTQPVYGEYAPPVSPSISAQYLPGGSGTSDTARGGVTTVRSGADTVEKSLGAIGQSLSEAGSKLGAKKGGGISKSGIIPTKASAKGAKSYVKTKMDTAHVDKAKGPTGGVKMGNAGGYKTGGVVMGQGGYKKGGAAKKGYATGGLVDSGKPVAYPKKPASAAVSNDRQSGTFKKGGKVKFNDGGAAGPMSNYEKGKKTVPPVKDPEAVAAKASRDLEDAFNPIGIFKELSGKLRDKLRGQGAVTETEKSVTVSPPPAKKKAGGAC